MKRLLLTFLLALGAGSTHSLDPNGFEQITHLGYVYARAIVKDEDTGLPLWAKYNEQGGHTKLDVNLALASEGRVVSGATYQGYASALESFKAQYEGNVQVLSKDDYISEAESGTLTTNNGQVISGWPTDLHESILTVAIPSKEKRYQFDAARIEKLFIPADLITNPNVDDNISSILMAKDGEFLEYSDLRIGYLTAFSANEDGVVEDSVEYESSSAYSFNGSDRRRKFLDPIPGVFIEAITGHRDARVYSRDDGFYRAKAYPVPCPGFIYHPEMYATARLNYANFHPRGNPSLPYWLEAKSYNSCNGLALLLQSSGNLVGLMAAVNIMGIVAAAPENIHRIDYPVAVNVIGGLASLYGATVGETTKYRAEESNYDEYIAPDDFDGDGVIDGSVRGDYNSEGIFEAKGDGKYYGVFLSSKDSDGQPDFVRVMDVMPDTRQKGFVETITEDDLKDTDILVFRESTGDLITERNGFTDEEMERRRFGRTDINENSVAYSLAIRSVEDGRSSISKLYRRGGFDDWQAANSMNPKLQNYKSDFLRNGEVLRIVAINRTTGYMGTALTRMNAARDGGDITVYVPPIVMTPPNLKVWATRRYQPAGLEKNADRERHTISNEGAATTDDYVIEVHTKWMDTNGLPLPPGLEGRGYTGRLVKVASDPNQSADPYSTQVSEFSINPGTELQVIKFGEGEVGKYHYHLQINGQSEAEPNDFASGAHTGVLRHRPNKFVPFSVPLYDEVTSNVNELLQKQAADGNELEDIEPAFNWVYRPELSFSVVDLEIDSILREDSDSNRVDLYTADKPILGSGDNAVQLLYQLMGSTFDRITPLDSEQTFIFALGEDEKEITVAKDSGGIVSIKYDNLDHLASLDPEDYLSLRLYLNEDSQNVLWKFSFDLFKMRPAPIKDDEEPFIYVTADEASENSEYINGMVLSENQSGNPYTVLWSQSGGISISPSIQASAEGIFSAELKLPVKADEIVQAQATINNSDSAKFKSAKFKIVPGAPDQITLLSESGNASIAERGTVKMQIEIRDKFNNLVVDGTPVQILAEDMKVKGDLSTVEGKIDIELIGQALAGSKSVKIKSGAAEYETNVEVADINLAITPIGDIKTGDKVQVRVTATGDVEGLEIQVGAHRGQLTNSLLKVQGGVATTELYAGKHRGSAHLFAKIGEKVVKYSYNILDKDEDAVLLDTVLVKDSPSGSFQISGKEYQYASRSQLRIKGTPGEQLNIALGSAANPIIKPLANYSFDLVQNNGLIADLQGDMNAYSTGAKTIDVDLPGQRKAMKLIDTAKITIANRTDLRKSNQIGFTTIVKPETTGKIVNFDAISMELEYLANKTLQLTANTSDGMISVVSHTVTGDDWLDIGAHFKDGELILDVDGQQYKAPSSGTLITNASAAKAITINDESSSTMTIATLAVIDWDGVQLLELDGGNTNGQFEVQADGFAKVNVSVPASTIAYYQQRRYDKIEEMYAETNRYTLFKQVYASSLSIDGCTVAASNPDYVLSQAEAMLDTILKCFLGQKIEQASIRYENASGWKETTVAFVEKAALQTVYTHLNMAGNGVLVAADCVQGVLTGNPQSGVGATCDFISSLLLIGDIRDLIYQGFYWFVDDEENYSPMTATFALLGVAGSGFAVLSGGTGSAAAVAAAAAKQIPKAFRGAKFLSPLGHYIDEFVLISDTQKSLENMTRILPFIELTAFVGFTAFSDETKEIRDFISNAIEDPEDLYTWVDYMKGMADELASGVLASNDLTTQQEVQKALYALVTFTVSNALAKNLWDDLQTAPVKGFIKIIEDALKRPGSYGAKENKIPAMFTDAIKELKTAVKNGADNMGDIKYNSETVRALMIAYSAGGVESLKRLRNHKGFKANVIPIGMQDFVKRISDIDMSKLSDEDALQLGKVFERLDKSNSGIKADYDLAEAQGATLELLAIAQLQKQGKNVSGFQQQVLIKFADGKSAGRRDADYFIDDTFWDAKAWESGSISKRLREEMGNNIKTSSGSRTGQMFRDFVNLGVDENAKKGLMFAPNAKGKESEILDVLEAAAEKNKTELGKAWGIKLDEDFDENFSEKLVDVIDRLTVSALDV